MGTIRFVKGDEREWINPLEKANDDNGSRTCMHQPGSSDELQLFEVKVPANLEVEAHVHDVDEIIVVTEGSVQFGRQVYGVGSSVFIPKMTLYSFTAGPDGLTYLNFRPVKGSLAIYKDEFLTMRNQRARILVGEMGYFEEQAGLEGKKAVVIGAAQGIGKGITLALARCGVDLALSDREEDALGETAAQAEKAGAKVMYRVFDAMDDDKQVEFFEAVDAEAGRPDILVNVPGGARQREFLESTPEDWDRDINWNYRYVVRSTYEGIRRMRDHGGSIVNITTIEGHRAAPRISVYAGAKAAVENFTRSIAVEFAEHGIRANTISPDKTPTPGVVQSNTYMPPIRRHPPEDVARLRFSVAIPMARPGRVDDVANCTLFLASDLSSYVTGQTLHVDGGAFASAGWFNWGELGYRPSAPTPVIEAMLDRPEEFRVDPNAPSDPTWLKSES